MKVDSLFDVAKLRAAERALKQMLAQQGESSGAVHSEIEPIPPASVRVRFVLVKK
jgi:outer membrane protein assembly factor BamA